MIKVTVKNTQSLVSQVKNFAAADRVISLKQLSDVDASDADNNETIVFDESTNKFVVKTIPKVQGGTF